MQCGPNTLVVLNGILYVNGIPIKGLVCEYIEESRYNAKQPYIMFKEGRDWWIENAEDPVHLWRLDKRSTNKTEKPPWLAGVFQRLTINGDLQSEVTRK